MYDCSSPIFIFIFKISACWGDEFGKYVLGWLGEGGSKIHFPLWSVFPSSLTIRAPKTQLSGSLNPRSHKSWDVVEFILKNNSESTLKFFSSCREKCVTAEASGNMSGARLKEVRVKKETCKNQSEPWGVRFCPELGKLYFLHTPLVASFALSLELLPADLLFYCLLFCSNLGSCI